MAESNKKYKDKKENPRICCFYNLVSFDLIGYKKMTVKEQKKKNEKLIKLGMSDYRWIRR